MTIKAICLLILLSLLSGLFGAAVAEEWLIKKGAKYLGWKASNETFRTCSGKSMQIEGGAIVYTDDKCPKEIVKPKKAEKAK